MTRTMTMVAVLLVSASGCFYPGRANVTRYAPGPVDGSQTVVVLGDRNEWTSLLEDELRARGLQMRRFASSARVGELTASDRLSIYDEASAPIALELDWNLDPGRRCFGGGHFFDRIRLEAIDLARNEVIMAATASGYSEKCFPMSGSIFGDFADAVVELWQPAG